jgi:hypothetical protein
MLQNDNCVILSVWDILTQPSESMQELKKKTRTVHKRKVVCQQ